MVIDYISPDAQIVIFTSLNAFRNNWAEPCHFDTMLDLRDMLLLGAKAKQEIETAEAARAFNVALANIRDSWDGTKFSYSDDEINALQMLVDISNDFWNRQSGHLFQKAYIALKQWRNEQHEDKRDQTRASETGVVCG